MKKLTTAEQMACVFLRQSGYYVPGNRVEMLPVMDSLVRKKRAAVEMTDDGPSYSLTAQGHADAKSPFHG
jgi:hypothetical protein